MTEHARQEKNDDRETQNKGDEKLIPVLFPEMVPQKRKQSDGQKH